MKKLISLVLIFAVYLGLISPIGLPTRAQVSRGKTASPNMNETMQNGLRFRLSEGAEGAEKRTTTPPTAGEALSENQTVNLLKRLPEVKTEAEDQKDFAKRQGSLPAPKTGKIVNAKFPAGEQRPIPNQNSSDTLEVIRFSPAGEVGLAPDLNVTFSQPMVAVSSQEETAQNIPVQLTPQPEGNWRWLGTKTLMFDATKRFPMATKFVARISAGTKSATGQILQKEVSWTFTTPPPKVETMIPQNQTTRRDALIFVSFDQEINPEAVLKTISVTSARKQIPVRLATVEEISKDENISYYVKNVQPNRWLALRAINSDGSTENALPADSNITVTVEKGTPSAEGPLTTLKAQSFSFKTFGALKFVKSFCDYDENKKLCSPEGSWQMQFSNPIDLKIFDKSLVKVEPNVENLDVVPSGNTIVIQGYKKGRTAYKVTVDGALRDVFGQTLGQIATAAFNVGSERAASLCAGRELWLFLTHSPNLRFPFIPQIIIRLKRKFTPSSQMIGRSFRRMCAALITTTKRSARPFRVD
ncbi:MAG: Ig-like domain-containing protein [Pyrinomonadaceae bacterium]